MAGSAGPARERRVTIAVVVAFLALVVLVTVLWQMPKITRALRVLESEEGARAILQKAPALAA